MKFCYRMMITSVSANPRVRRAREYFEYVAHAPGSAGVRKHAGAHKQGRGRVGGHAGAGGHGSASGDQRRSLRFGRRGRAGDNGRNHVFCRMITLYLGRSPL